MDEIELHQNKITCLTQLRLSKWQLIWNKEFELASLINLDKQALTKAELSGKFPPDQMKRAKQENDMKVMMAQAEIQKATVEIAMLDDIIKKLKGEPVALKKGCSCNENGDCKHSGNEDCCPGVDCHCDCSFEHIYKP